MQLIKKILSYIFVVLIVGTSILGLWHKQEIYDWYRLRDYTPSSEIENLAANTSMTKYGRKLFYVHDPRLEDRETFNRTCTHYEQSIVLGCYISNQSIHIFDVRDERLKGIREVTAAHEMLHAAYDRLGGSERKEIDYLVVSFYESIKNDHPRIRDAVRSYIERDVSIVNNELHSIIGTEVRNLSPQLEEYYARYFDDRQKVVDYAEAYESVFVKQQNKIKSLTSQIESLESELNAMRERINAEGESIVQESGRLTRLREKGEIEDYNLAVPTYNQRVAEYRSSVASFNKKISDLNRLIEAHNELAVEHKEMSNAIDSRALDL